MRTTESLFPTLSTPPIIEAIIGINLDAPETILARLKTVNDEIEASYPGISEIFEMQARFEIKTESMPNSKKRQIGWQFESADRRQVYQSRLTGFSFHRLAPYDNWDRFVASARDIWRKYRSVVGDLPIPQFSVRYINSIELPAGEEISDYISVYPMIPREGLPQTLARYNMNLELPLPNRSDALLVIRHLLKPYDSSNPGVATVLMDNEFVFRVPALLSDDDLWDRINEARTLKNDIFRASITDRMLDLLR